ncbi:MAG: Holliday junction branch migration protein RuvA [Bacteroidales bacterium]|jgi:Holliday junction DNA helicase RuvA|nr:Holliday junction branch migration protein RuvA [Bacteroidales bacterium]
MYEYFQGCLASLEPTQAVIDCNGVGYLLEITLNTYESLRKNAEGQVKLYAHHVVREDAQQLFGFCDMAEREMFRILVGVNGVGNQTARVMLSSLTVDELRNAIVTQDVKKVQRVKGIGAKTAQRIVLELADKVDGTQVLQGAREVQVNQARDEAMSALLMLGFAKPAVEKLLLNSDWNQADGTPMTVEEIIKEGLKRL